MANALVQFRVNNDLKVAATNICERLGMDLQTYMRICLSRLIQENGIPFNLKINDDISIKAINAMKEASKIAEKYGISNMSLDEINAEIAEARK